MLETLITSSVLILIIAALRFFLRGKVSNRVIYALWLLAALRLVLPFSLAESSVSIMNIFKRAAESPAVYSDNTEYNAAEPPVYNIVQENYGVYPQYTGETEHIAELPAVQTKPAPDIKDIVKYIRLGGTAVMLLWFVAVNGAFYFNLRCKREKTDIECRLPVYISDGISSPCIFGLFRPAVYITSEAAENRAQLKYVLAHELCHYKHGDVLWGALRCILLAVYWFDPFVWLAAYLSKRDCECACDEAVMAGYTDEQRIEYGRVIIGLVPKKGSAAGVVSTCMSSDGKALKERIGFIANRPKTRAAAVAVVIMAAIIGAGCTFTSAADDVPEDSTPAADTTAEQTENNESVQVMTEQVTERKVHPTKVDYALYDQHDRDIVKSWESYCGDVQNYGALLTRDCRVFVQMPAVRNVQDSLMIRVHKGSKRVEFIELRYDASRGTWYKLGNMSTLAGPADYVAEVAQSYIDGENAETCIELLPTDETERYIAEFDGNVIYESLVSGGYLFSVIAEEDCAYKDGSVTGSFTLRITDGSGKILSERALTSGAAGTDGITIPMEDSRAASGTFVSFVNVLVYRHNTGNGWLAHFYGVTDEGNIIEYELDDRLSELSGGNDLLARDMTFIDSGEAVVSCKGEKDGQNYIATVRFDEDKAQALVSSFHIGDSSGSIVEGAKRMLTLLSITANPAWVIEDTDNCIEGDPETGGYYMIKPEIAADRQGMHDFVYNTLSDIGLKGNGFDTVSDWEKAYFDEPMNKLWDAYTSDMPRLKMIDGKLCAYATRTSLDNAYTWDDTFVVEGETDMKASVYYFGSSDHATMFKIEMVKGTDGIWRSDGIVSEDVM